MRNHNHALQEAFARTQNGRTLIVKVTDYKRDQYKAHLKRYSDLKELLRDAFPKRRDIVYHAIARPDKGSSRLWEIAADESQTAKCADLLKWAGTSEKAFLDAQLCVNTSIK